jgi:hypothetical protein
MTRRFRQLLCILAISVPSAAFFVLIPPWQIEHPSDPALILRTERHFLWSAPNHVHLDPVAMAIPVIAIAIVAIALIALAVYNE